MQAQAEEDAVICQQPRSAVSPKDKPAVPAGLAERAAERFWAGRAGTPEEA